MKRYVYLYSCVFESHMLWLDVFDGTVFKEHVCFYCFQRTCVLGMLFFHLTLFFLPMSD